MTLDEIIKDLEHYTPVDRPYRDNDKIVKWLKELQAYHKAKAEIEERLKKHYASDVSNGLMLVNMIIDKHLKEGEGDEICSDT